MTDPSPAGGDGPPRIPVAVVGLGVGRAHVLALKDVRRQFQVVAVCDVDAGLASEVAGWLRGVRAETELAAVLAAEDIELVVLCTPPWLHREQVEACLRAGKDVVCEKPLVGSVAEVDELAAIEAETGRHVVPVFQYRFGRGLQRLRHLVGSGIAGRHYVANVDVAWRRGPDYYAVGWRGSWDGELGGVLLSHALHALDMLMVILGSPVAVWARTATLVNEIETEDCAVATMRFADGSLATLSATLGSVEEISRHRFAFEHLSAESNNEPYTNGAEPWAITPADDDVAAAMEAATSAMVEQGEDYVGLYQRYAAARASGSEPPTTLADARRALELITALYLSAREGREVELPLAADSPALRGWRP